MPTFNDTLNYLNTVLLQQGQEAPPYPDDVKWVIRDQLLELTKVSHWTKLQDSNKGFDDLWK